MWWTSLKRQVGTARRQAVWHAVHWGWREFQRAGMVTAGDLLDFLVELCPEVILNLPPEPRLALHPKAEGD